MEKLKPAEILKAVHTCGASFCATDHHECPYGDDGCIDCVDRLEADFEALIAAGDDLVIRRAAPANEALTLDELRQMDESTDVEIVPLKPRLWHAYKGGISTNCFETYRYEDYGKTWLAYARKPEGSE